MNIYYKVKVGDRVRILGEYWAEKGVVTEIISELMPRRLIRVRIVSDIEVYTNLYDWEIIDLY